MGINMSSNNVEVENKYYYEMFKNKIKRDKHFKNIINTLKEIKIPSEEDPSRNVKITRPSMKQLGKYHGIIPKPGHIHINRQNIIRNRLLKNFNEYVQLENPEGK